MQKGNVRAGYKPLQLHQATEANSAINWAKTAVKKVIIRRLADTFLLLMKTSSKYQKTLNTFKKQSVYHLEKEAQKWKDQL